MRTSNIQKPTVDWKYKLLLLTLFCALYYFFYIYPNLHPLTPPRLLPLSPIDRAAPFFPWTFWVYLSEYVLVAVAMTILKDWDEFNSWARMNFGALFICGAFFLFYPTTYPRPVYPDENNVLVAFAMNLVANVDTPNNCFPSLHVAITAISAWFFRLYGRKHFALFALWGLAILLSTLTTKQHYFIDVLGGLCVTGLVAYLEPLLFRKKAVDARAYSRTSKAAVAAEKTETVYSE